MPKKKKEKKDNGLVCSCSDLFSMKHDVSNHTQILISWIFFNFIFFQSISLHIRLQSQVPLCEPTSLAVLQNSET